MEQSPFSFDALPQLETRCRQKCIRGDQFLSGQMRNRAKKPIHRPEYQPGAKSRQSGGRVLKVGDQPIRMGRRTGPYLGNDPFQLAGAEAIEEEVGDNQVETLVAMYPLQSIHAEERHRPGSGVMAQQSPTGYRQHSLTGIHTGDARFRKTPGAFDQTTPVTLAQ